MNLLDLYREKKLASESRLDSFVIEKIGSIKHISDDAYLENTTWLGGDQEFVCLFIDLDGSSMMSLNHHPRVMAKIYDYFTQNLVDILMTDPFKADYIDIKGDGAFGIFEGEQASFKALCAALTFKTFFEKHIRSKFQTEEEAFNCKLAIDRDKVLVKKIGKRGNNNEVWAGRVVNHAAKLASLSKRIYEERHDISPFKSSLLIISEKIYKELGTKDQYTHSSCGHNVNGDFVGSTISNWSQIDCTLEGAINDDRAWFTASPWCDKCGDHYMQEILK